MEMKKNLMILQIILSNVVFIAACYFIIKIGFFDQEFSIALLGSILILCMFFLNNYINFKNYKNIHA